MRHEITIPMEPLDPVETVHNGTLPAWLWAELEAHRQNESGTEPYRAAAVEKVGKKGREMIVITAEMPDGYPRTRKDPRTPSEGRE